MVNLERGKVVIFWHLIKEVDQDLADWFYSENHVADFCGKSLVQVDINDLAKYPFLYDCLLKSQLNMIALMKVTRENLDDAKLLVNLLPYQDS